MIGGKAVFSLQLDNTGLFDLNGRGNENIIEPEPEEITPESVIGRRSGVIGETIPKGIDEWFGIHNISTVLALQVSLALQKINRDVFFAGIKISC